MLYNSGASHLNVNPFSNQSRPMSLNLALLFSQLTPNQFWMNSSLSVSDWKWCLCVLFVLFYSLRLHASANRCSFSVHHFIPRLIKSLWPWPLTTNIYSVNLWVQVTNGHNFMKYPKGRFFQWQPVNGEKNSEWNKKTECWTLTKKRNGQFMQTEIEAESQTI